MKHFRLLILFFSSVMIAQGQTGSSLDKVGIIIENIHIDDTNHPKGYQDAAIFKDFDNEMTDNSYQEAFSYVKTKDIIFRNVTPPNGKALRFSENPYMSER